MTSARKHAHVREDDRVVSAIIPERNEFLLKSKHSWKNNLIAPKARQEYVLTTTAI